MLARVPVASLIALAIAGSGCPCAGNPGRLINALPNATFASDPAELYISATDGIRRVSLDGTRSTKIFAKFPHRDVPQVSVVDVSLDGKLWLLSDSYTNLWIGDPTTGNSVEVSAVHGRMSSAAVSPDGKTIAATRHSDYSAIAKADEDDTVFLIDVATGNSETIPAHTKNWPTRVRWAADGSALWLEMAWGAPPQWLTLTDRKRTEQSKPPAALRDEPHRKHPSCSQQLLESKDPELRIIDDPEKPARALVRLEGRERGFHDYQADFSHAAFTPSCKFVVFEHRRQVWVTDLTGAQVGPIVDGDWLFFAVPRAGT